MHGRESVNDAAGTERGSAYNVDVHGASGGGEKLACWGSALWR